ncbi:MAG: carbohydrate ABC transporter permease [Christensenellales bacterium]
MKLKRKNKIKLPVSEVIAKWVNYVLLFLLSLTFILPFFYVISISFSTEHAIGMYGATLFPREFTTEAYAYLFRSGGVIMRAYGNTIVITVITTALAVFVTGGFAYPLSKEKLPFRKGIMYYVLFSMLFGGGLIPSYLVMTKLYGLKNSIWAIILPGTFSAWNMIIMKNFFSQLPKGLEEAALIDGANEMKVFISIVLPLSKPIIACVCLFNAVGQWNNWFGPLIYLDNTKTPTIMLFLKGVISSSLNVGNQFESTEPPPTQSVQMATVMACTLPIILIYPFLQKYFAAGVLVGGVKG